MNNDVLVSVKSRQVFGDMSTDYIELIIPGSMESRDGGYCITYFETDPETSAETRTTVTTVPGVVTVVREGDIESEMIFEQGRKHIFHYDMSEGSMTMGVAAKRVNVALGEAGGRIDIDYAVEIENSVAYENRLRMKITRPQSGSFPS